ncbi:MAG: NAD(P)-dependent oxidoreductase [Candidatus Methylacidiphilales bacterium]|nr:NAD(P)-dependent oxidoreductase [Candidatus Methylacidiphilales bacterium]
MPARPMPEEDLDDVFGRVGGLWERLRGSRVLLTGGSGFFGGWMLQTLLNADTRLDLGVRVVAPTRDRNRFGGVWPALLTDPRVEVVESDAVLLAMPDGPVDYVIHCLVPDARMSPANMDVFFQAATRRLVDIAVAKKSTGFLLCSTGAVYQSKTPPEAFAEGDPLVPYEGEPGYSQVRRRVEDQCGALLPAGGVPLKIARGFSFVGPGLPEKANFAVADFIRDGLAGGPIVVKSDGSAVRSYLYASDMAVGLWTIFLARAEEGIFNLGSAQALALRDLAHMIGSMLGAGVSIQNKVVPGAAVSYYVPRTTRAERVLGFSPAIELPRALEKSIRAFCI